MPVLLVPASYVEGKTRTIAAAEAEHGSPEDTLVATTMGEVSSLCLPAAPHSFDPHTLLMTTDLVTNQLLPLSFGPEDLAKPRPGSGANVVPASERDRDATAAA